MYELEGTDFVAMTESEYLEHFGVPGMKWGHRKDVRYAKKDAKETQKAKFMYGDTAGTRRKLITNQVAARSKRSPTYKKAYDQAMAKQDNSNAIAIGDREHKKQVHKETRHRINRRLKTAAIQGGTAAAIIGASYAIHNPQGAARTAKRAAKLTSFYGQQAYRTVKNFQNRQRATSWLKKQGIV